MWFPDKRAVFPSCSLKYILSCTVTVEEQVLTLLRNNMDDKLPLVKKRQSESLKAKSQQRRRRRHTLFTKAKGYGLERNAHVSITLQTRDDGQIFIFNTDSSGYWPLSRQAMVCPTVQYDFCSSSVIVLECMLSNTDQSVCKRSCQQSKQILMI